MGQISHGRDTRLAATVSRHMQTRSLTLRDVEEATAIPRSTLHQRIAGRSDFRVDELVALARLFDLTPGQLLAESEVAA